MHVIAWRVVRLQVQEGETQTLGSTEEMELIGIYKTASAHRAEYQGGENCTETELQTLAKHHPCVFSLVHASEETT